MGPARANPHEEPHELLVQAEKIAHSPGLAGSEILRGLLLFLAKAAIERPGESLRETEIASAVLGRKDFDSRVDSGVRVHTARLRAKLAEYYVDEGAGDPIVIEIPKRSYQLLYRSRGAAPVALVEESPVRRRMRVSAPWLVAAVACVAAAAAWVMNWHARPAAELRTFWAVFVDAKRPPMVVFATPRFVGSGAEGLRAAPKDLPRGVPIVSEYTGVGEVIAISRLTSLFGRFECEMQLKRSEMVTWDDARQRSMVLVGGPETNFVLAALPQPGRFAFTNVVTGDDELKHAVIEDRKPPAGSPRYYTNSGRPFRFDHALIAYTPGEGARRPMLILAGTTTMGTQAAAEYVTDPEMLRNLLAALHAEHGAMPRFEALLKATLRDGAPVSTEVLAVHRM